MPGGPALRVMTFNLLYAGAPNRAGSWERRRPLAIEVIRENTADLVGVQEATEEQLADLERELPEFGMVSGPGSGEARLPFAARALRRPRATFSADEPRAPQERDEYCAILYRAERFDVAHSHAFWLSHTPHEPGSVLPGSWLPRVVNCARLFDRSAGCHLSFYCAHLDFTPWSPGRSAALLRGAMDDAWDGGPQLLVGDFNAVRFSGAYRTLARPGTACPGLVDMWQIARRRHGPDGTYHAGGGRPRFPGRLDRLYVRPGAEVEVVITIEHHRGRVYPSDHFPVLAELRWQ